MGLIKLGLVGAAGYAIARKVNNKHTLNNTSNSNSNLPQQQQTDRPPFRDTKSGYQHQGYCNGQCGQRCNGQQTHGFHDWTCNTQCGGQCATQRQMAAAQGDSAQGYYGAGSLDAREALPNYESSGAAAKMAGVRV